MERSGDRAVTPAGPSDDVLRGWAAEAEQRNDFWVAFVNGAEARSVAEIGVYRGGFAQRLLEQCPGIASYTMVDPWRHLEDWNKPANKPDEVFERLYADALSRTEPWADKRVVLRGRTAEVIHEIEDGSLDLAYIDGDHTLRGITTDLVQVYPKVREGGWIGGDDLAPSIWQHGADFEPTLVFPLVLHFAEAVGARIWALPFKQFLLEKRAGGRYEFVDLTGLYGDASLLRQFEARPEPAPEPEPKPAAKARPKRSRARSLAGRAKRRLAR